MFTLTKTSQRLTTSTIIRQEINSYKLDLAQLGKLFEITDGRIGCDINLAEKLREEGFFWFVKPSFILKFRFHACLYGNYDGGHPTIGRFYRGIYGENGMRNLYIGNIPNTVLDKIKTVKDLGIKHVTIHSMEPLPIAYNNIDPVAVGWFANPQIHLEENFIGNPSIGFVIGLWDMEKEQEVL